MQGVVGVYSKSEASRKALYTLYGVQHRGQESAGLAVAGDHSLRTWKDKGLLSNMLDERFSSFTHPDDYVVVGCTSGENANQGKLPPYTIESKRYTLSLALDGHISKNGFEINEEVFGNKLLEDINLGLDAAIAETMKALEEAYYSLVMAVHDKESDTSELVVARDRFGIRPLYIAWNDDEVIVASESAPIDVLESLGHVFDVRRDFNPGMVLRIGTGGMEENQVLEPRHAHCVFEWVYFGRPDSVIEGQAVHTARRRLGTALVETHDLGGLYGGHREDLVIIPVPDSGRSVCTGVAEALGMPADEGVIKNAYLGRTYIIDDPTIRKIASDLKHNVFRETVRGKKVVITDDSIVRGTVSESVAQNLVKAGAAEVDFLVSYGPIFHPCFSDSPDKPLAAVPYEGKSLLEVGELVASKLPSINNVRYNSPENVVRAIGLPRERLCIQCMNGENPLKGE